MERKEIICKKKSKCFQNEHILDFSKEQQFKIRKESLEKYSIKVQIKKTTNLGNKSMKYDSVAIFED